MSKRPDADRTEERSSLPVVMELRKEMLRVAANERQGSSGMSAHRVLALTGLGLAIASVFLVALIFDSDGPSRRRSTQPAVGSFGAHGAEYPSLRELARHSKLILVGTVTDTRIGKVFDDDPEYPTRLLHTTLSVEEVLKGSPPSTDPTIVTDELGFSGPTVDEWRNAGTRVLLFLTPGDKDRYVLANLAYPQAAYVLRGEDVVPTTRDPLNNRIAAMSLQEVRQEVQKQP
jgi:hypothetical protein